MSKSTLSPLCKDLPTLTNLPQALCYYYVLEGATHGGQFHYRHLKEVLSIEKDEGCSIFNKLRKHYQGQVEIFPGGIRKVCG